MVISHNMAAMNAYRQSGIVDSSLAKSTEKLSSGFKINRAADDAAGLAISVKMRRQIRGLNMGSTNIQDGISLCQVMDGALAETQDIMQRMTELAVKAANETLSNEDRQAIEAEISQLKLELDRTTTSTTFNEQQCLAGIDYDTMPTNVSGPMVDVVFIIDNTGSMSRPIANVKDNLSMFADSLLNCNVEYGIVEYGELNESLPGGRTGSPEAHGILNTRKDVKDTISSIVIAGGGDGPESALEAINEALTSYSGRTGAYKQFVLVTDANYHDTNGGGTDVAANSTTTAATVKTSLEAAGAKLSVVTSLGYSSIYQAVGASSIHNINDPNFGSSLKKIAEDIADGLGVRVTKNPEDIDIQLDGTVGNINTVHTYNLTSKTLGLNNITCVTAESARNSIDWIKTGLARLSTCRAQIGADQNSLMHDLNINANTAENTEAADSAIKDTDMAKEMVEYSLKSILSQASNSMLAQANQEQESVLSLLQ